MFGLRTEPHSHPPVTKGALFCVREERDERCSVLYAALAHVFHSCLLAEVRTSPSAFGGTEPTGGRCGWSPRESAFIVSGAHFPLNS